MRIVTIKLISAHGYPCFEFENKKVGTEFSVPCERCWKIDTFKVSDVPGHLPLDTNIVFMCRNCNKPATDEKVRICLA